MSVKFFQTKLGGLTFAEQDLLWSYHCYVLLFQGGKFICWVNYYQLLL